jgi:hypothetical protein
MQTRNIPGGSEARAWTRAWFISALVALFFCLLELRHPYYFLQDDNRVLFLGYFAQDWRALTQGTLALFNFHQFLGTPFLALGQTAVLYPPAYLAVAVSKLFFGHIFAAVDIYIIAHLALGAAAMFCFLKRAGFGERAASLGAFAWPLNGFLVFVCSNWLPVAPVALYFPLMLLLGRMVWDGGSDVPFYSLVAVRLGLFYTGHVQYFTYCVVFEILYLMLAAFYGGAKPGSRYLLRYSASFVITAVLSLPLLLPMWHLAQISADRAAPLALADFYSGGNKTLLWLRGLVWPLKVGSVAWPGFRRAWLDMFLPCYAHVGIVMLFCAVAALRPCRSRRLPLNLKAALALLLLALAWSAGWLNPLLYIIPVMNRFHFNLKLVLFANFMLIMVGAAGYEIIESRFVKTARVFHIAIFLSVLNFGLLYIAGSPVNFSDFQDSPPFEAPLDGMNVHGRIIAIAPPLSGVPEGSDMAGPDYAGLVAFNYATLWGYDAFAGYQTLIPKTNAAAALHMNTPNVAALRPEDLPSVVKYLRMWGVGTYIVPREFATLYSAKFNASGIKQEFSDFRRAVFADYAALPPVRADNGVKPEYSFSVNGIEISKKGGPACVAVIDAVYNTYFTARVNGAAAHVFPDAGGQLAIALPAGCAEAEIYYRDPLFEVGLVLFFSTVLVLFLLRRSALKLVEYI